MWHQNKSNSRVMTLKIIRHFSACIKGDFRSCSHFIVIKLNRIFFSANLCTQFIAPGLVYGLSCITIRNCYQQFGENRSKKKKEFRRKTYINIFCLFRYMRFNRFAIIIIIVYYHVWYRTITNEKKTSPNVCHDRTDLSSIEFWIILIQNQIHVCCCFDLEPKTQKSGWENNILWLKCNLYFDSRLFSLMHLRRVSVFYRKFLFLVK